MSIPFQNFLHDQEITAFSLSRLHNILEKAVPDTNTKQTSPVDEGLKKDGSVFMGQKYSSSIIMQSYDSRQDQSCFIEGDVSQGASQIPRMIDSSVIKVFNVEPPQGFIHDLPANCLDQLCEDADYDHKINLTEREEFSTRLHKEGWLQKKTSNIFGRWQRNYFQVKNFKVSYAKSPDLLNATKNIRSINLRVHLCEISALKDNSFNIKIQGIKNELKLKADSLREAIEWYEFFKDLFAYTKLHCYQGDKYLTQERPTLFKVDTMTEEELLREAETGDLLLFKRCKPQEKANKTVDPDYDNVSIIIKIRGETYIYDAKTHNKSRLKTWKSFKNLGRLHKKQVIYRKLCIENKQVRDILQTRLYKFILIHDEVIHDFTLMQVLVEIVNNSIQQQDSNKARLNNKKHNIVVSNLINSLQFTSPYLSSENDQIKGGQKLTSSQLVAIVYKFIGLLSAQIGVTEFLPASFMKDINLIKEAYLSGYCEIILLNS